MAEKTSIWEALGFRKASGVGEAGWGRTLVVAIVSFIYFLPVLMIIFTAIKPASEALSVPPTLSPTSLFGLIPDQYVFTPTLENFGSVFNRVMITGGVPEPTGFDRYFFTGRNTCVACPKNTSALSITVSDNVGCGWITSFRSSAVAPISMASAPSEISSPAPDPTRPTPRIRPVFFSTISLVSPSGRSMLMARPLAPQGNLAMSTSRPFSFAWASV